ATHWPEPLHVSQLPTQRFWLVPQVCPLAEHWLQTPSHAVAQQTPVPLGPRAQKLLAQSAATLQLSPRSRLQMPPRHVQSLPGQPLPLSVQVSDADRSSLKSVMLAQVPSALSVTAAEQPRHVSLHALSQHTLSTQNPVKQVSVVPLQVAPSW